MSFKRRVLSALGKAELLDIARGLELDVVARMGVDELRDAVAKSKRASLTTIVQESLSRDTLKEICAACGLDDSGKEKASLVESILAAGMTANGYKLDPANTRACEPAVCYGQSAEKSRDAIPISRNSSCSSAARWVRFSGTTFLCILRTFFA